MESSRRGVSTAIFAAVTIILLIATAAGFYLYSTASATAKPVTSTSVSTSLIAQLKSGGFVEGNLTSFIYTQNYVCTPAGTSFVNNAEAQAAAKVTACIVGAGSRTAVSGAFPVFVLVPAFAGLSNFGVTQLGASSQGYPVFDGQTIATQCGGGGSASACPDHPTYLYSPDFTLVEQHLGIKTGVFGLPEGVLPTPAHDHVAGFDTNTSIPWYAVAVLVFDPNVFPNAVTGQCTKVVDSNLTNPTGNCLTSFAALASAMDTRTTATANANTTQSDPIYSTFGGVPTQVLIPGVTIVSENSATNTNLFIYFSVLPQNPYA
ncbi:MAG: hypothetical protein KGI38_08830 [Thaumarchaeota archaeon]|nr:hypothetical protein [Nitrososphaerota archaeon]